jgi:hypothetical protein
MQDEINKLISANIVRKGSAGTWSSPAFMIKQKDSWRLVVKYQKLNKITKPFYFPVPRTNDQIEAFGGYKRFFQLDARKGFLQMALTEKSKKKLGL